MHQYVNDNQCILTSSDSTTAQSWKLSPQSAIFLSRNEHLVLACKIWKNENRDNAWVLILYVFALCNFAIYRESLDLEPKYACIVPHTLLDIASIVHP